MKRVTIMLFAIFFSFVFIMESQAGNRAVNGLLIGAGSGAILGQAAGKNTESVLIGTAIGGAVGYAIGNSMDNPRREIYHNYNSRPVVYRYQEYQPHEYRHRENRSWGHYQQKPYYRNKEYPSRYDYKRRGGDCDETVVFKKSNHKVSRIVKTTCDRPRWYDRDHHRSRWYR